MSNKESQIQDLATLFFDSWMMQTQVLPSDFGDFVIETSINSALGLTENYEDKAHLAEELNEVVSENPQAWMLLYMYHKDMISKKDVKEMIQGKEWKTSCHGDYIEKLEKDFGVSINKK